VCPGFFFFFFFLVLWFELRAFTLSHSTSPFGDGFFFQLGSCELFAQAGLKAHLPDLCLLSSWDYRREPPAPSFQESEVI
jgi:hypothetical protein